MTPWCSGPEAGEGRECHAPDARPVGDRHGIAAAAHTALPVQAETFLVLDDEIWDDDGSGASSGNGNGVLEFGETVELTLPVRNIGLLPAQDVQGTLACDDPHSAQVTPGDGEASPARGA